MSGAGGWPFTHSLRIRYGECDMQGVVFNAHYLAFCDDTSAAWMADTIGWTGTDDPLDWMLVHAEVDWQGSATYGDTLVIDTGVARWGRTSFTVRYRGRVGHRPVFTAESVHVCVAGGSHDAIEVPQMLRDALGDAPPA